MQKWPCKNAIIIFYTKAESLTVNSMLPCMHNITVFFFQSKNSYKHHIKNILHALNTIYCYNEEISYWYCRGQIGIQGCFLSVEYRSTCRVQYRNLQYFLNFTSLRSNHSYHFCGTIQSDCNPYKRCIFTQLLLIDN